ncbi:MAG: CapA family protein [Christensenellaceae bacterium]|nr:CapA family protein [Christensenellaceae bacterium]
MRKLALLIALMTALTPFVLPAALGEEDDLSLEEVLSGADPSIVANTFIAPPDEAEDAVLLDAPSIYEPDGSVLITITGTGDFTIGGDSRKSTDIFNDELKRQGGDINFTMRNMRDILLEDDLTIVNFEGTLTETTYVPSNKRENQFLFSAPPSYVTMLSDNGIEAVSLENNHVMDHGEDAYQETINTLVYEGIVYSNSTHVGVIEVKGVEIAMLSYLCIDRYEQLWDKVPADIAEAKAQYPIVIVSFHWGNEKDYSPTNNQIKMGRLAVDSGADLVLGHHSHRLNPIEQYKGVYICYSLGNFCFSGNKNPSDMTSFVFQTRFRVLDGVVSSEGFRIIPIRISSRTDRNDFIPTPLTKDTAIDSVLKTLKENGRKLEYAVENYPLEW